jgi:uncharacterized protein
MSMTVWLAHGASGTAASMGPWVNALVGRGIEAHAIDLPRRRAEDAVPALVATVPATVDVVVGGHSYGGRVASLAAAEPAAPYRAVVLLSYPLHRPGRPDTWEQRVAHWPQIRCPVLLLSGESDPFARVELLRTAVRALPHAELHTWPRLGHTLKPVLDEAVDRIVRFLAAT